MRTFLALALFTILSLCSHAQGKDGQWIAPSVISEPNTWIAYRKDIRVDDVPEKAVTMIAADSKYWLYINGDMIVREGSLKRGPNPRDTYYDEIDLAPYLNKGENKIAILLWHFGKEGFSHKNSGKAGLLFEMSLPEGKVVSDNSWLCRIHPAYQNTDAPFPNYRLAESNIRFDATADIKGWETSDNLKDRGFRQAVRIAGKGEAPYNSLIKRPIPQWKDFGVKDFEKVVVKKGVQADTLEAYLPYNLQMTPVIQVTSSSEGKLVSIYTDNTYAAGDINLRAEYITVKGRQSHESPGWLNGHIVYFVIPHGVTAEKVAYRESGYDTELSGSFSCNDDFINNYWKKSLRTLYVNMRDTFFDCPERERAQWWGDVTLLMGECFYTCDESTHALMRKGMLELVNWQKEDGGLFSPVPAGNYDSELPGQMLASIGWFGFWNYYMNTGDVRTIREVYPGVRKYLSLWTLDDTGLTNFRSGGWTWGDWGDNKDVRLIFAGWHYLALKAAREMALLCGFEEDAAAYAKTMARVKDGYNKCWNGKEYRHPDYKECTDDRVNALAVVAGIADKEKYPQILKVLKTCFHASPYMERYVTEALFLMGEGNYAVRRMKERYAPMVNHPFYTTLFEGWDIGEKGFGGGTVNHAWSGGGLIAIAQHICGITPETPGWKTFNIKPNCNILKNIEITIPTVYGKIRSRVLSESDRIVMEITVPEGTSANVTIPGVGPSEIFINSRRVGEKNIHRLPAGDYRIERIFKKNFTVGDGTFLLNGRPFTVKAAELHYPRIPREYWEHRIEMCKALGMNTICMYVFWNYHERNEGEFDFEGNADIAEFCRLAQKHGMYVIVRPGPYVCAEWEMGGLPWWLLKKDDVRLRTLDPHYMAHVKTFLKKVGDELSPMQISKGGNIIMVQVENEYGSYGTDKPYISEIKNALLEAGFTDVPLFQCDWSSNFTNNALDDLLWTVNFGTGADINREFSLLRQLRPRTPLMCSEYWSGWFDHWGRKHETRPAEAMVDGIRDMLENNISFSLYMTHGGTTFGHWGGANNPPFSAMCSSYDYDAPISESGQATEKYMLLRSLLAKYNDGSPLPEIPESKPVTSIPEFRLTQVAQLFENLPSCHKSEQIKPMEHFDQGWGTILYRCKLPFGTERGSTLKITELHDYGQVFVDGRLTARLDRRKGEMSVNLPPLRKGARLDILVEAMGRVNFDRSIHDRKGITEKVELITETDRAELKNWKVYSFPVDTDFAASLKYEAVDGSGDCSSGSSSDGMVDGSDGNSSDNSDDGSSDGSNDNSGGSMVDAPAYYKGEFTVEKPHDTFLDMRSWGKGLVWVNGHEIGRFWEIGPQQTLYLPGCWLKKGKNEIYVLDIIGCKSPVIKGLEKPILDDLRTEASKKDGKKIIDLSSESQACKGSFPHVGGWKEVKFDTPASGRYFCFEMLSLHSSDESAAIAEFDILGPDGKAISRENWKIAYADSEDTRSGNHSAEKIFDLQESTYWSASPDKKAPHRIVIEMDSNISVTGFRYLPRAESGCPGMVKEYSVYVRQYDFNYTAANGQSLEAANREDAKNELTINVAAEGQSLEAANREDANSNGPEQGQAKNRLRILPYPQEVLMGSGSLVISNGKGGIYADSGFDSETALFLEQILGDKNILLKKKNASKAAIRVLRTNEGLPQVEGAYRIRVSKKECVIEAADAAGAFYGLQTLSQMMEVNERGIEIPQCTITDHPLLSWRSFMLDEGRSFKGMKVVKRILDDMARLKLNIFHWHLTDDQGWRIEIKKYPKLTEIGSKRDSTQVGWYEYDTYDGKPHEGFYTQDEIREIIEYAGRRHITVIPEIEMPGHSAAAVAAYPWLSAANRPIRVPCRFGVQYNVFNPADEKVLKFLEDVIDEVSDLFSSKVIHIGGDEVRYNEWKDSPQVMNFIEQNDLGSPAGLQVWFTNRMASYIESKGKRMMGWNDITGEQLHHFQTESAEIKVGLSPKAIVQFWLGDTEKMIRSARRGNDIVNSFNEYTYLDYSYDYDPVQATYNWKPISLEKAYSFNPIPTGFPQDLQHHIIGAGCQMWGEWIPTVEKMNYQIYPRIAAYAEAFWLPDSKKSFERFKTCLEPFAKRWKLRQ